MTRRAFQLIFYAALLLSGAICFAEDQSGYISERELDEIMRERERVMRALSEKLGEPLGDSSNLDGAAETLKNRDFDTEKNSSAASEPKQESKAPNFSEPLQKDNTGEKKAEKSASNTPEDKAMEIADAVLQEQKKKGERFDEKVRSALLEDIKQTQDRERQWSPDLPEIHDFYQSTVPSGNIRVYSTNYDARNLGTSVSEYIDEVFVAVFGRGIALSHPIEIHMLLESEANFSGNFLESVGGSSNRISVKANMDLNLEEFFRRVINLYLKSYAFSIGGDKAFGSVPYWLELAMGARVAQRVSNGVTFEMARYAQKNPPELLDKVFDYKANAEVDRFMESSAYWNLLALKVAFGRDFAALMSEILKSPDRRGEILNLIKDRNGGKNFDIHWRAYLLGEIYSRLGGVKSLKESDDEILRLAILLRQRQGDSLEPVLGEKIFEIAKFSKAEIDSRLLEIKLALPWVNPVYYNSLVALGKMYQAAFDGDKEAFELNRADFLNEFKNAREISKRALELLK